jgi:hypothetical protein
VKRPDPPAELTVVGGAAVVGAAATLDGCDPAVLVGADPLAGDEWDASLAPA